MNVTIRDETPEDFTAIRNVTIDAFSVCTYGHNGEADLIEHLRACTDTILSLVACLDGKIVGHILFTPVVLHGPGRHLQGMGLAPMSVAPKHQRTGV